MIPRISMNEDRLTLDDVWEQYQTVRDSVNRRVVEFKRIPAERFFGKTEIEVQEYFDEVLDELDIETSFFLLASIEAEIRTDFLRRVYERRKDPVSRRFRETYKGVACAHDKAKVRLEEDILDPWAQLEPEARQFIGDLKGALKYRNWLAHGRYWIPKLGRLTYDPSALVRLATDFFRIVGITQTS